MIQLSTPQKSLLLLLVFIFSIQFSYAQLGQWIWMKGDSLPDLRGVYGIRGVSSSLNKPGGMEYPSYWTDFAGNFWLRSGIGLTYTNDTWKFNPLTNEWTWVKGDSTSALKSVYGAQGVAAATNNPRSSNEYIKWRDEAGNFWLLSEVLWKFEVATQNWIWMKGDTLTPTTSVYGTRGVANASNRPGQRSVAATWTDNTGNLWLYGGMRYINTAPYQLNFSDLWKYNITTNQWTWMNGDTVTRQRSIYGTKGISAPSNKPGNRNQSYSWTDASGNLWLFGGEGVNPSTMQFGIYNDLWKYNIITNEWAWINGDTIPNVKAVYGSRGLIASTNKPGARNTGFTWRDTYGDLWMASGNGFSGSRQGGLNDFWKYNIVSNKWTWMDGDSAAVITSVYGTKGVASLTNHPGERFGAGFWLDNEGNFWQFGAEGYITNPNRSDYLNDLWKYSFNPTVKQLCPQGSVDINADITSSNYQWQLSMDSSNFVNILNSSNIIGVNTATLHLSNVPSSWRGRQFRCLSNGVGGSVSTITFTNQWTGGTNNDWENPANWSCGSVPDANTDVTISSGNVILNSDVIIRSLVVSPGASFTVGAGHQITVLH